MKQELSHGIETEEQDAKTEEWKEHGNNVTEEVTNHTKVQLVETTKKKRTQSLVATSMENFILENVGSELPLVSTVDKKEILLVNAKIKGRKIAQE